MNTSRNRFRVIYSALVIAAFFIPAYSSVSAFGFLRLALGSVGSDPEVTWLDLAVVLIPLLFIPISATIIIYRALNQKMVGGLLLSLPLFFLLFFTFILSFDLNRQINHSNVTSLVKGISIGFYLAIFSSVLLLLSYSKRESLNFSSRHR